MVRSLQECGSISRRVTVVDYGRASLECRLLIALGHAASAAALRFVRSHLGCDLSRCVLRRLRLSTHWSHELMVLKESSLAPTLDSTTIPLAGIHGSVLFVRVLCAS